MTEDQVLKTVGTNSCVVTDVAQPAFPSTAGSTSMLTCGTGKGTGFLDAQAWFRFKDGKGVITGQLTGSPLLFG